MHEIRLVPDPDGGCLIESAYFCSQGLLHLNPSPCNHLPWLDIMVDPMDPTRAFYVEDRMAFPTGICPHSMAAHVAVVNDKLRRLFP